MKYNTKHPKLKSLKFDEWLYLVHHIHHYINKRGKISYGLHHCSLFSEKDLRGKKYKIRHLLIKNKFYHVLKEEFSGILYDHANNSYAITFERVGDVECSLIRLNKKIILIYERI